MPEALTTSKSRARVAATYTSRTASARSSSSSCAWLSRSSHGVHPHSFRARNASSFRHSYRSWLDETGAPLTVQKELMRHASIQTTMNIYGKAMADSKRQDHSKVVERVLNGKNDQTAGHKKPVAAIGS
jgi:integrase